MAARSRTRIVSEANGSGTLSGSHTYAEAGTYTVSVNVQDNNGGASGPQTFKVKVNNVPPQLINVTGSTIDENGVATVKATIQDPGVQDTFSVAVNWQDFASDTITGLGTSDTSGFIGDTGYQWTAANPPNHTHASIRRRRPQPWQCHTQRHVSCGVSPSPITTSTVQAQTSM